MGKVVEIIAKKEWHFLSGYIIALALFFGFAGVLSMSTSIISKNYTAVPAFITDITSREVWRKQGPRTEYEYTVHWIYEGVEYKKRLNDIGKGPDEQLSEVWINADNTDMVMTDTKGTKKQGMIFMAASIVLIILWIVLMKKSKNRPFIDEKRWNSLFRGGCFFSFLMTVGTLCGFGFLNASKNSGAAESLYGRFLFGVFLTLLLLSVWYTVEVKKQKNKQA